jgi:hypothetical protein
MFTLQLFFLLLENPITIINGQQPIWSYKNYQEHKEIHKVHNYDFVVQTILINVQT